MKKYGNIFFYILIVALLIQRAPSIREQFEMEGTTTTDTNLYLLDQSELKLSALKENKILVFWASWCGPCKLELARYHSAIKDKEIPNDRIIFVNMGEDKKTIKKYLSKNEYKFKVALDQNYNLANQFKVKSTPTVIHLTKDNKINYIGSGFAPLGIYRAIWFLE